ncbi:MAG: SgcJ/EcaC family oxidoreductase [Chromatiales bacterium]
MQNADELRAIGRLYQRMAAAAVNGDAPSYAACYAEDGALMPPHDPPLQGRAQVMAWAEALFGTWAMKGHSVSMDDQRAGATVAFARYRGVGSFVPRAGGEAVPYDLKYMDTLVRQPDGTWLIACHMWSSNGPGSSIWTR